MNVGRVQVGRPALKPAGRPALLGFSAFDDERRYAIDNGVFAVAHGADESRGLQA